MFNPTSTATEAQVALTTAEVRPTIEELQTEITAAVYDVRALKASQDRAQKRYGIQAADGRKVLAELLPQWEALTGEKWADDHGHAYLRDGSRRVKVDESAHDRAYFDADQQRSSAYIGLLKLSNDLFDQREALSDGLFSRFSERIGVLLTTLHAQAEALQAMREAISESTGAPSVVVK